MMWRDCGPHNDESSGKASTVKSVTGAARSSAMVPLISETRSVRTRLTPWIFSPG